MGLDLFEIGSQIPQRLAAQVAQAEIVEIVAEGLSDQKLNR